MCVVGTFLCLLGIHYAIKAKNYTNSYNMDNDLNT